MMIYDDLELRVEGRRGFLEAWNDDVEKEDV